MPKLLARFLNYLRSYKFFRLVMVVFLFESIWIAVSAAYPQAFDENFHFGLIKVYSHYWLPFLTHQPPHADAYGAVAVNPSYFYHYLMSFPYRFIELFTTNQTTQVILLRLLNVGMFAWAIVLFRKILLRVGSSNALTNLILMLFVLIPIVPQLAGQISYDNLMIPLVALSILLAFKLTDQIRSKSVSIYDLALFLGLCLIASIVKYAFLPIFAGLAIFLLVVGIRVNRHRLKDIFSQLASSWRKQAILKKTIIVIAVLIPLGLFSQRYAVNLVEYHSINPSCRKVLTLKQCMAYSPWAYNYKNHVKVVAAGTTTGIIKTVIYPFQWLYWMWYRLFFAVNGPKSHFANYPPLPLPSAAALLLIVAGAYALVKWWRKIFNGNLYLILILIVSAVYTVALIGKGYSTYRYTAVPENMNGRYLLPILILAAAIFGQALSYTLRKTQGRKVVLAMIALLFFLEGGGIVTFIARSDPSWDIDNKTVVKVNNAARKVIKKVVVRGSKGYSTKLWFFN